MSKRIGLADRNKTEDKIDNFFMKTEKPEKEEMKRQTYYLTLLSIKALALKSAFESKDKNIIFRECLEKYIGEKYISEAKNPNIETLDNNIENPGKKKNSEKEETERKTFILSEVLIKALALKSAIESRTKNEIVREALASGIEEKYFEVADSLLNK